MFRPLRIVRKFSAGAGAIVAASVVGVGMAAADTSTAVSVKSVIGVAVDVVFTAGGIKLKRSVEPNGPEQKLQSFPANTTINWVAKPKKPTEFTECSGEEKVTGSAFTIVVKPGRCMPNFAAPSQKAETEVSVHSQFGVAVDVNYTGGGVSLTGVPAEPNASAPLAKAFPANTKVHWIAKPKKPTEFTECSGEATVNGAKFTIELTPGRCMPNFDWKPSKK